MEGNIGRSTQTSEAPLTRSASWAPPLSKRKIAKRIGGDFKQLRLEAEALVSQVRPGYEPAALTEVLREMDELIMSQARRPAPAKPEIPSPPALPAPLQASHLLPEGFIAAKSAANDRIRSLQQELEKLKAKQRRRRQAELQQTHLRLAADLKRTRLLSVPAPLRTIVEAFVRDHPAIVEQVELWAENVARAQQSHDDAVSRWQHTGFPEGARIQYRVLGRIRADIARAKQLTPLPAGAVVTQVPWRLLPPPEPGATGLARLTNEIRASFPHLSIDERRLKFAYSLNPVRIFIGAGEFDGYLAFQFSGTARTLLECPVDGNAAYIFSDEWRTLSRLSKTELLQNFRGKVARVIHVNQQWQSEIKRLLK